jgi:2-deoxy-D-gluconate 3-dehydrogenase
MSSQPITEFFNLKSKTAVVTGSGVGIGKAIALRLAEAGASVLVVDRQEGAGKGTAEEIKARGGIAAACVADVSVPSDAKRIAAEAVAVFGRLDILVNNASIYPPALLLDVTEETWDRVLDINLKGVLFCSQAAARRMIDGGHGGKIINIASVNALHPSQTLGHYGASKGGVVSLTQALAQELAPHRILVNAVAPGIIKTPGLAQMLDILVPTGQTLDEKEPLFAPKVPLGRLGEPDDIAKVVLFLASSAADYMAGQLVIVDGGWMVG